LRNRIRSTWLSYKLTQIYCIDFSGYGADQAGLAREVNAVNKILGQQAINSMLVTLDMHQSKLTPEVVAFFHCACQPDSPIRKLAIMGVNSAQRAWYRLAHKIHWPKNAVFLNDYETAKAWVIREGRP
jgi:hypothetical protein